MMIQQVKKKNRSNQSPYGATTTTETNHSPIPFVDNKKNKKSFMMNILNIGSLEESAPKSIVLEDMVKTKDNGIKVKDDPVLKSKSISEIPKRSTAENFLQKNIENLSRYRNTTPMYLLLN